MLRDGHIIAQGDPAALMARGGHYAELYNTCFRHRSVAYIESWRKEKLVERDTVAGMPLYTLIPMPAARYHDE